MPRNSSGSYTLPAGNPVTFGTTISTTWANGTLSDLATEVGSSLDRSGRGPMLAPLRLPDGTAAAPALAFAGEVNSGLYRVGPADVRLTVGGVDALKLVSGGVSGPLTFPNVSTAFIASTGANGSLFLQGNRNAADPAADVLIGSTVARTAGLIADFHNPINAISKLQVDYQGLLRLTAQPAAIQPASVWTAITPDTGWTAYEGLGSWKDALGRVHLKGSVRFGSGGSTNDLLTLPAGFRPLFTRRFPVIFNIAATTGENIVICNVNPTGVVSLNTLGFGTPNINDSFSLDGVSFLAEQ